MTTLQQLSASQASPEVVLNENAETTSYVGIFGKRQPATTGLTWGYYGGIWPSGTVANGTVALTGSATNYVVVNRSTGVVSVSTSNTNWNNTSTYARLYLLTTSSSAVTAEADHRSSSLLGGSVAAGLADADYGDFTVSGGVATLDGTARTSIGATIINGATSKTTPVDADQLGLADSAASNVLKKLTWANLKATIKTYTDTLYAAIGAITGSGLTMATGKLLGRSTASTGAIEEITVGSGLSLSAGTLSATGGTGTVTATGGSLTANSVVLGAGTTDTKVVAGITTDGASALNLGVAGSSVGKVVLANATSGTITMQPPTGALGTVTVTVPAATDTLVNLTGTQTLTNKTLTNAVVGTQTAGDNSTKAASTAYADAADVATTSPSFSATPTLDTTLANVIYFGALTGNVTAFNLSGTRPKVIVCFKQDATGGRTVTAGTSIDFGTDIADLTGIASTANAYTYVGFVYNPTTTKFRVVAISK